MSRHVVFNENHFTFHNGFLDTRNPLKTLIETILIVLPPLPTGTITSHIIEPSNNDVNHQEQDLAVNEDQSVLGEISITADEATSYTNEAPATIGRPQETCPVENTSEDNQHVQQIRTRGKAGIHKPKLPYIRLTEIHKEDKEPENVNEAQVRPRWKEAMDAEFKALTTNHTWILVPFQAQK